MMTGQALKVLVVSSKYPPEYSGSGNRAHNTYKRLQNKYDVHFDVLAGSITENKRTSYEHEGVKVSRVASKLLPQESLQAWDKDSFLNKFALRLNYFSEALPTFQFLSEHYQKYDLIHVFGNAAVTSAAVTFCGWQRKPLIVEVTYDSKPQQYKPFFMDMLNPDKSGFPAWAQIICISKRLEKICQESGVYQRIWTRPNPVDTDIFCVDRKRKSEYRNRHSRFKENDIVLVNVAKFMPLKNQDFLIDVLRFLPDKYKLVLAGPVIKEGPNLVRDQDYMKLIRKKISDHRLDERVQITESFVSTVDEYMKMADVYVFPSKMEGLGTPMIESICCGVPVVANRLEGVTDTWIKERENGYLSPLEPQEFAKRIELAAGLPEDVLDQSAEQLHAVAGVNSIDQEYYRLLELLISEDNQKRIS